MTKQNKIISFLDFEKQLKEKLKNFENPRPFICNGNLLECEVFIVGINAATEMEKSFWNFWVSEKGFQKEKWFENYIKERQSKPLAPGKTRRNKISSTRQRIELIVNSAKSVKILETNLFSKATPKASDLKNKEKDTSIFEFLLKSIQPKFILIHGSETLNYLKKLYKIEIEKNKLETCEILGIKTTILAKPHLSKWRKIDAEKMGKKIEEILKLSNTEK